MEDIIHLNGTSNAPLRNASWSVVNISGATPTTLVSGPYLTTVQPVSEDVFEWNLTVEVGNLDCTCFVSIEHIDEAGHHENWHVLLYLGTSHHRPVFLGEWNQQGVQGLTSTEDASSSELITESSVITYSVVLAPGSTSLTMVSAEVCEAPYGVCLAEPVVVNVPFELVDGDLQLTVAPGNMSMDEGVWNMAFTAVDEFLRSTGVQRTSFVYDASPPTVALVADSSVLEREEFNVYATIEDGYIGAEFTYTWTIVDDNDVRRAPSDAEFVSSNHLVLNLTKQGSYTVDVAVRDRAGLTAVSSLNFTVLNQPPTARISVDGRVFSELGQLTVDENGGWEINGNLSTDNEPVDYLWVVNDDRSWRGLASLNQEHFEQAGVHRVELIVFDDDGATHSTVLELEILAAENEETTDSLAWIGVVLLVGVLVGVFAVRRRSSGTQSLPKWTVSPTTSHEREPGAFTHHDATVEEDEARG